MRVFIGLYLLLLMCPPPAAAAQYNLQHGHQTLILNTSAVFSDARDKELQDWIDGVSQSLLGVYGRWPRDTWQVDIKPLSMFSHDPVPWAHVRRGDFHYGAMRHLGVDKVIAALRRHGADTAGTVLIVSDVYDEALLEGCRRQGWTTVCWAQRHPGDPKLAGILDMLCCCLAWRFVGTRLSTFSSGIMQWRGYVSRVTSAHVDAVPRFTAELDQVYWWALVDTHAWLAI